MNPQVFGVTLLTALILSGVVLAKTDSDPSLEQAIKTYIEQAGSSLDPTQYQTAKIDLNNDHQKDALVFLTGFSWCGSGGCSLLVFEGKKQSYHLISEISLVREPVIVSNTETHGWRDIIIHNSGGGLAAKNVALQFDGHTYPSNPSDLPPISSEIEGIEVFSEPKF